MTVLVPVLDGACLLPGCLDAIAAQDHRGEIEVLVVDGGSSDGTRAIARASGATVLDNPDRIQAAALNVGLAAATGDVIVRVDVRTRIEPEYVGACVRVLERTGAALVGGHQRPIGADDRSEAIAAALTSRFGGGPARYRDPGAVGWVDTVYLGAAATPTLRRLGGWDASLAINEDADLARRAQRAGGVYLDAGIRSTYLVRGTVGEVAKQYEAYGRGRAATVRRDPRTVRPRQVVPLLLAAVLLFVPLGTFLYLAVAAQQVRGPLRVRRRGGIEPRAWATATAVVAVVHLSWSRGFLAGLVRPAGAG